MLTAIFQNGESIANPQTATSIAVGVHQCADGQFDVRDHDAVILCGPFRLQETANSAARMLSTARGIAATVTEMVETMKG